jgi:exopolysaccharide biosynthesis polyprenyl glycosylphosphotransferase
VLTLSLSFFAAYLVAPYVRVGMLHWLSSSWVATLAPDVGAEMRPVQAFGWVFFVMATIVTLALMAIGAYRPLTKQSLTQVVVSSVLAPLAGLAGIALCLFALRNPQWSRVFIFVFTAVSIASLGAYRSALRWYKLRRIASGIYARHVALAGSPRAVAWIADYLRRTTTRSEYQLAGAVQVGPPGGVSVLADDLPALGDVDSFADILVHRPIHEVIAIQGAEGGDWLKTLVKTCDYFRVTLRIVPEALLFGNLKDLQFFYHADPLKLPEVVLRPRDDVASDALFAKRLIDIIISGTLLVVLAPLFAVIAIAIKLTTPNLPIFYRWQVVGFKGRRFTGYKFSTMVADADSQRETLLQRNEMQGPVFKIKEDPRVTPLGRYLRKFSLNELPQLWSVLKGDMSLVGPRPAFLHELARYELWHKRKLCVRPGITCLWQVSGRNRISHFDDWVRMDLEYIDNWSLWLDAKILMRTVWAVLSGSGS